MNKYEVIYSVIDKKDGYIHEEHSMIAVEAESEWDAKDEISEMAKWEHDDSNLMLVFHEVVLLK